MNELNDIVKERKIILTLEIKADMKMKVVI